MMKQRQPKSIARRRPKAVGGGRALHPPPFVATFVVKRKIRFQCTAALTAKTLQIADFGDLWMTTPTAATGFQIANFVRIRKIEMWGPMAADLIPVTCSVEWAGTTIGLMGKSSIQSDTSMGADRPAHVASRPPPGSQIAQWFACQGNQTVVILNAPVQTVLDLTIEFVVRDDGTATAVATVPAGATVGATYVRALDTSGGAVIKPVSIATK